MTGSWLTGADEQVLGAVDVETEKIVLQIDQGLQRAVEVPCLIGDSRLARQTLGWQPSTPFPVCSL